MRPTWDDVWLEMAVAAGRRSLCIRQCGAAITTAENRIIATGYNGPPAGLDVKGGCQSWCTHAKVPAGEVRGYGDCYSIHAEANALLYCSRRDRDGGTIYTTMVPCWECAKLISNSGLRRVVAFNDQAEYREPRRAIALMQESGLDVILRDA